MRRFPVQIDSEFEAILSPIVSRTQHGSHDIGPRQRATLIDAGPAGIEGGMSTRKYEQIGETSRATASRELLELEALGCLRRFGAGRSTHYQVAIDGWGPAPA
ncbi:hypothetical protein [Roseateles chitinivorans]|uniref:hypothetical protein n=1 Tax=Roseateles chitinivorans TaxID=2917965 RepID=UPI003D6765E2